MTVDILPEIKRVRGVGTATILGNRTFAMRIRLNPDRMRAHNLSSEDIMKAFSGCSMVGSPGRLVQATEKTSQSEEYVLTHIGRFNKPEQYENIILKANPDGEILRLKDVGEVESGPSSSILTRTSTAIPRLLSSSSRPPAPTPPRSSRRSRRSSSRSRRSRSLPA